MMSPRLKLGIAAGVVFLLLAGGVLAARRGVALVLDAPGLMLDLWGNFNAAGYNFEEQRRERPLITATVSIITNENTVDEKRETHVLPLRKIGDLAFVRALRW